MFATIGKSWKPTRKKQRGLSLAETLVALGLLGVVMIPMLFMSSAFFTNQLMKTRNSMEVSHNSAQFLSRFMEEVGSAQKILPAGGAQATDATHLYMAYYDPIAQQEKKYGYQLTASGGSLKLERLIYNSATGNWDTYSPYPTDAADQILLPAGTTFKYCDDRVTPTCTTASSNDKALIIRLSGWTFQKNGGSQQVALPTVDVAVGTNASAITPILLSDAPKQIYSFPSSNFAGTPDNKLIYLPANGVSLNNLQVPAGAGAGVLSTIVNGQTDSFRSADVGPDGRLFINDTWLNVSKNMYTYHPSTGLSTLVSSVRPGSHMSHAVSPIDGRFYFGKQTATANIWTWHPDTGLSTIASGNNWGLYATAISPIDGRIYMGESMNNSDIVTWSPACGISTLLTGRKGLGYVSLAVSPVDGRVYFAEAPISNTTWSTETRTPQWNVTPDTTYNRVYTWKENSGTCAGGTLQTIASVGSTHGVGSTAVDPVSGSVFFGEMNVPGSFVRWNATKGLSTILNNTGDWTGYGGVAVASDGRVYFGDSESDPNTGGFWSWKDNGTAAGALTMLITNAYAPGEYSTAVAADGRVFFGETTTGASNRPLWTWKADGSASGVLSTIIVAKNPGHSDGNTKYHPLNGTGLLVRPDGRIFFSDESNTGKMWTWREDSGLSVIYNGGTGYPGETAKALDYKGRLYFEADSTYINGTAANAKPFLTWFESTGLSTIIGPGVDLFGTDYAMTGIPNGNGGVYFQGSGDVGSYNIFRWEPLLPSATIYRNSYLGTPSNQALSLQMAGSQYTTLATDSDQNLFLLDPINYTVDTYVGSVDSTGSAQYNRVSQFKWSTWANFIGAMAVDNNSQAIALLDTGNKQVDVYANRMVNGTPAAPTQTGISGNTANPTGIAISSRTGNYLVVDSTVSSGNIDLDIYKANASYNLTYDHTIQINVSTLTPSASAETNFKILVDDQRNVLFLIAPNISGGQVYALSMPEAL